jgi:hypothetical protein
MNAYITHVKLKRSKTKSLLTIQLPAPADIAHPAVEQHVAIWIHQFFPGWDWVATAYDNPDEECAK